MSQKIEDINIKDLVLWTENPRDPINKHAKDQDVVDRALNDELSKLKWSLPKLAKEMGNHYDYSELPTVVYHGERPVVYDGNRRIILGKIKHRYVKTAEEFQEQLPEFPKVIPCNVCSEKIALENVLRKHGDSGSWLPLERDIFLHRFMKEEKSHFLLLEENTNIISTHPHLNKRFVKEEVFNRENLEALGFSFSSNGKLQSIHKLGEARTIITDLIAKIGEDITTRKNRGQVVAILTPASQKLIENNREKKIKPLALLFKQEAKTTKRRTQRGRKKDDHLFGGILYLRKSQTNDLYRDIVDLYCFYCLKKDKLSGSFISLIRMSLRLLCETAAKEKNKNFDNYVKDSFDLAKSKLSKDMKTTLSNHNVTKDSVIQLLHTGAHNYHTAKNMEQTIAVSIIIGQILMFSHGQK